MTSATDLARESFRRQDGRFGTQPLAEADGIDLGAPLDEAEQPNDRDWGTVSVNEGSRTPWGAAQSVSHPAPGIVVVSCAGHGGVKLSPERNAEIPPALRNKSGWYEEDCESYIVSMYHPESAPSTWDPRASAASGEDYDGMTREQAIADHAESKVIDWFPDAYEKATGKTVTPAMSSERARQAEQADKEMFRAAHADEFVTLGNGDTHADWIPKGYAACEARMDITGETRTFLMPRDEVIKNGMYGNYALVNPNRHLDVTDVVNAKPSRPWTYERPERAPITGTAVGIDYSGLTSTQANRASEELNKRWRFANDDGSQTVESLGEHIARIGTVGKQPRVEGDKVTYRVMFEGSRVLPVSKSTYDALTGVPDVSTDTDKAYVEKERARVRVEKVQSESYDGRTFEAHQARLAKAQADHQAAVAAYTALSDRENADGAAWQAERDQMRRDAFAALLAEKGLEL